MSYFCSIILTGLLFPTRTSIHHPSLGFGPQQSHSEEHGRLFANSVWRTVCQSPSVDSIIWPGRLCICTDRSSDTFWCLGDLPGFEIRHRVSKVAMSHRRTPPSLPHQGLSTLEDRWKSSPSISRQAPVIPADSQWKSHVQKCKFVWNGMLLLTEFKCF